MAPAFKAKALLLLIVIPFILSGISCGGGNGSSNSAGSISLSWETPSSMVDGSPLADLAGYHVYYGTASKLYREMVDVGNAETYTISNLVPGTYYFAVTAYDTAGNETDFSEEVTKTVL